MLTGRAAIAVSDDDDDSGVIVSSMRRMHTVLVVGRELLVLLFSTMVFHSLGCQFQGIRDFHHGMASQHQIHKNQVSYALTTHAGTSGP